MHRIHNSILRFIFLFLSPALTAQTIQVGSVGDDAARFFQLMGKVDSSISFTVRPLVRNRQISNSNLYSLIDSNEMAIYGQPVYFANKNGRFNLLPVTVTQQFNTHHPYGWNDGAMIASKGYQTLISAGIYAAIGPLEVQLQPELVYAANSNYENNSAYGSNSNKAYQKIFPGQSSVRLSAGPISIGVSTENLWWGPGRHSSLLMSNNAPGFIHGFFSSKKPVKTPIGDIEWQLIGGKLTADDSWAYENYNLKPPGRLLNQDWRYLNAYVVSYHPKWVPGLFLGMTRALQRYKQDIKLSGSSFLDEYIPVLTKAFQKQNAQADDTMRTDQLASFFVRWVLPKAKAEFYIEWGYNDYNQNVRDYVMGPTHSAAHLIGFKKVFDLKKGSYLDFGFEMTQMSQTPDYLVRNAGNWYEHGQILQGYTHNNQILGAGAGFGSNVQSIAATWIKGWKQLGLLLERVEHDPLNHANNWVDIGIGILPQWKYQNIVFSGVFQFINSSNYAWEKDVNRFNLHSRLRVQFLF